ncbi:unnamed protein product [Lymnaea stagnalis]|uniref:dihydrofolate reductase n=1 Tax=Lymnaea stagnalis TaxID=6523 RepID=A0AAV2HQ47_LYMST
MKVQLIFRTARLPVPHRERLADMSDVSLTAIAAICDGNRGIGKNKELPWPFLKEDYEFYTGICMATRDPNKQNGVITGRVGWEAFPDSMKTHPRLSTVVTSTTLSADEPFCRGVARDFDEAVQMFTRAKDKDGVENIYILGGRVNYEHAVTDPRCRRLIITRIFQDFDADVFFPEFDHVFRRISDPDIDDRIREDPVTGIKFRFEVWEKI